MTDRLVSEVPMAADAARVRRLKRYRAYKNSGVECLGEIPAHWSSIALSRVTLSRCDGPFDSGGWRNAGSTSHS